MISNKKRGVSDSDTPSSNDQKLNTTHLSTDFFLVCPRTEKGDLQEFFPLELGS